MSPSAAAVRSPRAGLNSTVGVGVRVIRVVVYLTVQNMAREAGLEINFKYYYYYSRVLEYYVHTLVGASTRVVVVLASTTLLVVQHVLASMHTF